MPIFDSLNQSPGMAPKGAVFNIDFLRGEKSSKPKTIRDEHEKKPLVARASETLLGSKFRERMVNSIYPYGYSEGVTSPKTAVGSAGAFTSSFFSEAALETSQRLNLDLQSHKNRYDAFRMYANLPQANDTFSVSDHRPTQGSDTKKAKTVYYKLSDKNAERRYLQAAVVYGLIDKEPGSNIVFQDGYAGGKGNSIMNTGTLGFGKDEKGHYISYYDKWDLAGKDDIPGIRNVFGRPFHIYNRIHISEKELKEMRSTKFRAVPNIIRADANEGLSSELGDVSGFKKDVQHGLGVSEVDAKRPEIPINTLLDVGSGVANSIIGKGNQLKNTAIDKAEEIRHRSVSLFNKLMR